MKLTLILALALPIAAQDSTRMVYTGLSYSSLSSAKPEAGFAGFSQRITEKAGSVYSLTSWTITANGHTAETSVLKPFAQIGPLSVSAVGGAGVVTESTPSVDTGGKQIVEKDPGTGKQVTDSNVGLSLSTGLLMSLPMSEITKVLHLPWKADKVHLFFGGQVIHQAVGTQGIEVGGQRIRVAFGLARDWSGN